MSVGGGISNEKSTSSNKGTETMTPAQRAEYERLLGGATDWLNTGGAKQDTGDFDAMRSMLTGAGNSAMETLTGAPDTTNLTNMLNMVSEQGNEDLKYAMSGLDEASNVSGNVGSRKGIAQGLATSNINRDMANQKTGSA